MVTTAGGHTQDIPLIPHEPWICQAGWENLNPPSHAAWASPAAGPKALAPEACSGCPLLSGEQTSFPSPAPRTAPAAHMWGCLLNLNFAVAANTGILQLSLTSQGIPVTEQCLLKICLLSAGLLWSVTFFIRFCLPGWWNTARIKVLKEVFNYCSNASLQPTSKHQQEQTPLSYRQTFVANTFSQRPTKASKQLKEWDEYLNTIQYAHHFCFAFLDQYAFFLATKIRLSKNGLE